MKNKIFALLLALVMVIGLIPFTATEAHAVEVEATSEGTEAFTGDFTLVLASKEDPSKTETHKVTHDGTNWSELKSSILPAHAFAYTGEVNNIAFTNGQWSYKPFLQLDQSDAEKLAKADVMTATGEVAIDAQLDLHFEHYFAKVTFRASFNTEFDPDNDEITEFRVVNLDNTNTTLYNNNGSYTAIMQSARYAQGAEFALIEVNGDNDNLLKVLVPEGTLLLDAGTHYTFDLKVGKEAVNFNIIDATAMSVNDLNAAVAKALAAGETDIEVTLAPRAPAEMFTAIRRALIDTEGVDDGSINLTLKGVTAIPRHNEMNPDKAIFGTVQVDSDLESVFQLASIRLPDVLTIGDKAFMGCEKLTSLYAPNVQTVDKYAFDDTALTSVELPKATTIDSSAFMGCTSLTTVKLPSATSIGDRAFSTSKNITDLELTADGAITLGTSVFDASSLNFSQNVNLVLHGNKSGEVNGLTWKSYTFKSITFVCADGTTNHTFTYTDNGDGTHEKACSACGYVEAGNENHTPDADGKCVCGASISVVRTAEELNDAVAQGGYIMLGDSITISAGISISKDVTLNLNGKTLTSTGGSYALYVNISGVTLKVFNGTIVSNNNQAVYNGYGTVFVENCTLTGGYRAFYHVSGTSSLKNCTVNGVVYTDPSGSGTVTLHKTITFGPSAYVALFKGIYPEGASVLCDFDPTDHIFDGHGSVTNNGDGTWTVTAK